MNYFLFLSLCNAEFSPAFGCISDLERILEEELGFEPIYVRASKLTTGRLQSWLRRFVGRSTRYELENSGSELEGDLLFVSVIRPDQLDVILTISEVTKRFKKIVAVVFDS